MLGVAKVEGAEVSSAESVNGLCALHKSFDMRKSFKSEKICLIWKRRLKSDKTIESRNLN